MSLILQEDLTGFGFPSLEAPKYITKEECMSMIVNTIKSLGTSKKPEPINLIELEEENPKVELEEEGDGIFEEEVLAKIKDIQDRSGNKKPTYLNWIGFIIQAHEGYSVLEEDIKYYLQQVRGKVRDADFTKAIREIRHDSRYTEKDGSYYYAGRK